MRYLAFITLRYLCGALLFAGSIQALAQEETIAPVECDANDETERLLPAGTRCVSFEEQVEIEEGRIEEQKEENEESKDQPQTDLEEQAPRTNDAASLLKLQDQFSAGLFYSTHPGAFHWPLLIGNTVELEDNSLWAVNPGDSYKTLNWIGSDVLVIAANSTWLPSYYLYRIHNQSTGVSIEANLSLFLSPLYHSLYNHRIAAIDDILQIIWLEDGSAWSILSCDYSRKWQIGDTILIGINTGWFSTSKPNILINALFVDPQVPNPARHARAACIGL